MGKRAGKALRRRRNFQKRKGNQYQIEIKARLFQALHDEPRGLCHQPVGEGRLEMLSCSLKSIFFRGFGKGAGHWCFEALREQDQAGTGLVHNPPRSCMHPSLKALSAAAGNRKPS